MNENDRLLSQLPDYLGGGMSPEEQADFEARLRKAPCKQEVEELRRLWKRLGNLPQTEPAPTVAARFYDMLEAYKAGREQTRRPTSFIDALGSWLEGWWPSQPARQFGLALALLFFGALIGHFFTRPGGSENVALLRNEVSGLRQMVATALLQSRSPSERLRGVSYSYREVAQPGDETLRALMNTLNYDPNLNVRLAAADALELYSKRETIRRGILESLKRQTAPQIQVALIDLLVEGRVRRSIAMLDSLRSNSDYDRAVRLRAGRAIEQLR